MNLKYYLRGLGLGIMVTALILAIAGNRKNSMTDAQIKERAKELGMIENTMLVEKAEVIEEENEAEAVEAEEQKEEEVKNEVAASNEDEKTVEEPTQIEENQTEDDAKTETDDAAKTDQLKDEAKSDDPEAPVHKEESGENDTQTVDEEPQIEDAAKEKAEQTGEGTAPSPDEEEEHEQPQTTTNGNEEAASHGQGTLTIVSGDSSYSVAKKLYDMGIVTSVEQTDRFLCANGYDRTIRTGTYTIGEDETLEQIAKKINGK